MDNANETSLSELPPPQKNENFVDDESFENEISPPKKHEIENSDIRNQNIDHEQTTSQSNLSSRERPFRQPRNSQRISPRKFFSVCFDDILSVLTSSWLNFGLITLPFTLISWIFNFGDSATFAFAFVTLIPIVSIFV
jgi:hypothetical protein